MYYFKRLKEEIYNAYHSSRFENDDLNPDVRKKSFDKDTSVSGIWTTDDEELAKTYGRHLLNVDVELNDPLVVDFAEQNAGNLPEESAEQIGEELSLRKKDVNDLLTTDDVVEVTKKKNMNDGVIFTNIQDAGPYGSYDNSATEYVAFDKDQVKIKSKKFIEKNKKHFKFKTL
jgi:hypothetical protein